MILLRLISLLRLNILFRLIFQLCLIFLLRIIILFYLIFLPPLDYSIKINYSTPVNYSPSGNFCTSVNYSTTVNFSNPVHFPTTNLRSSTIFLPPSILLQFIFRGFMPAQPYLLFVNHNAFLFLLNLHSFAHFSQVLGIRKFLPILEPIPRRFPAFHLRNAKQPAGDVALRFLRDLPFLVLPFNLPAGKFRRKRRLYNYPENARLLYNV